MVMYYCGQFAKKIPYAASCKPVRMYLELKERFIHPCCMTFLKTYFYQFSREHDICSHFKLQGIVGMNLTTEFLVCLW